MKQLKKKNLTELAEIMPVVSEREQQWYVGGGGDGTYTAAEFEKMLADGTWSGGYVDGFFGYVLPEVICTPGKNPEDDVYRNPDGGGQWSTMYESGYEYGYKGGSSWSYYLAVLGYICSGTEVSSPDFNLFYYYKGYEQGEYDREHHYDNYYGE